MVPVPTFEKVMVPVPVPTFGKLRFRFRFWFLFLARYGSGSGSGSTTLLFSSLTFKMPTKNLSKNKKLFCLLLFEATLT
jgi:hypothetical protein